MLEAGKEAWEESGVGGGGGGEATEWQGQRSLERERRKTGGGGEGEEKAIWAQGMYAWQTMVRVCVQEKSG